MLYGKFLVWRDSSFIMGGEMREGVVSVSFRRLGESGGPSTVQWPRVSIWTHLGGLLFRRKCQNFRLIQFKLQRFTCKNSV